MAPPPLCQPRRGREAVAGFFAMISDFEFRRFEPLGFLADGDLVAVPLHVEYRNPANDRVMRDLEVHLWTFGADGLASRFRHVVDTRQLGLGDRRLVSRAAGGDRPRR